MKSLSDYKVICETFDECDSKEHLVWVDLDTISQENLFPNFFKTDLSDDRQIKHIVTME